MDRRVRFHIQTITNASLLLVLPMWILFVITLFGCSSDDAAKRATTEEVHATHIDLQNAFNEWRKDERITGATMSVYSPTYGQYDLASGLSKRSIDPDRSPDVAVWPDKPMFVGDITHLLVAATVIQLDLEELLNLEANIEKWFPEIENSKNITIRNLLEHTSGVPVFYTAEFLDVLYEQEPAVTQDHDEVIAVAAAEGSFFDPGSQYGYSKTNFLILGRIIEMVTGNSLHGEFQKRFFDPLGMTNTYLAGTALDSGSTPLGYEYAGLSSDAPTVVDGHVPQVPTHSVVSAEWASGALVSTPADVIKLVQVIFQLDDFKGVREEILRIADHPAQASGSSRIESGAGVFTWTENDQRVIGQFGFIYPFSAQFVYWPDAGSKDGTVIVVIANEVDSSRNPNSNFQLPVIESLTREVKMILDGG
jgi:CubicO group peptidase (beta-lactamase class C family)